jgi:GTP-binding protein
VLNKTEGLDKELLADITKQLRKVVPAKTPIVAISAQAKQGLPELVRKVAQVVARERAKELKKQPAESESPVFRLPDMDAGWKVERAEDYFVITGTNIERFAARTDFSSEPALQRLRDILKKQGILHDLARRGAKPGDKIHIGTHSLSY